MYLVFLVDENGEEKARGSLDGNLYPSMVRTAIQNIARQAGCKVIARRYDSTGEEESYEAHPNETTMIPT